jgi:carbonic anhydrase
MSQNATVPADFDDLIAANKEYASHFTGGGFDGIAHAGVALVTCMDSRIDPLRVVGLSPGDAKIFRNPGGRITSAALEALVLGVHLLNVQRILVVPHTKCAMTKYTEPELREKIGELAGQDASWQGFHVIDNQREALLADVRAVRSHPLIGDNVAVGGFMYDVDTGLLEHLV